MSGSLVIAGTVYKEDGEVPADGVDGYRHSRFKLTPDAIPPMRMGPIQSHSLVEAHLLPPPAIWFPLLLQVPTWLP